MVKLTFHGQACFEVEGEGKKVLFDPFLTGNPLTNVKPGDIKNVDAILLTHGHGDHVGDAEEIARNNKSLIVAPFELATFMGNKGLESHPMHIGGSHKFPFGWVKLVQANHGSAFVDNSGIHYTGNPCGFFLEMDGVMIYHAGDTGLFGDMRLFKEYFLHGRDIDVALIPIGDNYVMGPDDAFTAVKWIGPKLVIPMHYNTFQVIVQNPEEFKEKVEKYTESKCKILQPGESSEISK